VLKYQRIIIMYTGKTAQNTMNRKKKTTASAINQIKQKHSLEILATSKLKYCGHIMCTSHSMEKDLMLGLTDGYRRGKQRTR
jgi:hypothetical protein